MILQSLPYRKIEVLLYEAKLEFPEGRGDAKQKAFCGGRMVIFWNCTLMLEEDIMGVC